MVSSVTVLLRFILLQLSNKQRDFLLTRSVLYTGAFLYVGAGFVANLVKEGRVAKSPGERVATPA